MSDEHADGSDGRASASNAVLADEGEHHASPALRLQILTTEHWSLLSTRSL